MRGSAVTDARTVSLRCGACAARRPDVTPPHVCLVQLEENGRVRVDPLVRVGGQPRAMRREAAARSGGEQPRPVRSYRSPPGPLYSPRRALTCRRCGHTWTVVLKRLRRSAERALSDGRLLLLIGATGEITPDDGWRGSH